MVDIRKRTYAMETLMQDFFISHYFLKTFKPLLVYNTEAQYINNFI